MDEQNKQQKESPNKPELNENGSSLFTDLINKFLSLPMKTKIVAITTAVAVLGGSAAGIALVAGGGDGDNSENGKVDNESSDSDTSDKKDDEIDGEDGDDIFDDDKDDNKNDASTDTHIHTFSEWKITIEPKCLESGEQERKCSCGTIEVEYLDELGHKEGDWKIITEASKANEGLKQLSCTRCNEILDEEIIPAIASVGLAYVINENKCTITGIGTCIDTDIFIPSKIDGYTVSAIGEKAFENQSHITNINIPNTVSSIGRRAFYGCTGLTEITIPSSVKNIDTQIFYNAENLHTVYYNSSYFNSENKFMNLSHIKKIVFDGGTIPKYAIEKYEYVEEVVIGSSISSIGVGAFRWCGSLKKVVMEEGVTTLGNSAFYASGAITDIVIPASLKTINSDAFTYCESIERVYISDIEAWCNLSYLSQSPSAHPTYYGADMYLNGELLTELTIPETIKEINWKMFESCTSIKKVIIPDSVTVIGSNAFRGCSNLTSVVIPDSVETIGDLAFSGCKSLTNISIPDSVTSFGQGLFRNCSSLTDVKIYCNMRGVDSVMFSGCSSLKNVILPESLTIINYGAFEDSKLLENVYFMGSEHQWKEISISSHNDPLNKANIYFNYVPEE